MAKITRATVAPAQKPKGKGLTGKGLTGSGKAWEKVPSGVGVNRGTGKTTVSKAKNTKTGGVSATSLKKAGNKITKKLY